MMQFFMALFLLLNQVLTAEPVYLGKKADINYADKLKQIMIEKWSIGDGNYLNRLPSISRNCYLIIGINVFSAWEKLYLVKSVEDANKILKVAYDGMGYDNFYTIESSQIDLANVIEQNFTVSNVVVINDNGVFPVKID